MQTKRTLGIILWSLIYMGVNEMSSTELLEELDITEILDDLDITKEELDKS